MFDFAWSEIALIGVVALVLIGPKDLPVAIKAVSDMVKKARRMAGEFQSHVDEMVKDTSLAEVRQQISDIRNLDIRGEIQRAVDPDGSIRSTLTDDPFRQAGSSYAPPEPEPLPEVESEAEVAPYGTHGIAAPPGTDAPYPEPEPTGFEVPAFIPPGTLPPPEIAGPPPAFIPPDIQSLRPARR